MQSIERIGAPSRTELNGGDGYIATMRELLTALDACLAA